MKYISNSLQCFVICLAGIKIKSVFFVMIPQTMSILSGGEKVVATLPWFLFIREISFCHNFREELFIIHCPIPVSLLIFFYLSSTYLLDVLTVSSRLFSGQTDEQTTACLSAVSLLQLEHVSAGLADSRHFSDAGRLWITKPTSAFWFLARACAWPNKPNPVTSVAAWALY